MKKVSIIIVTYNSEKDIYDCINSIIENSDIPLAEIELVVVDNNSIGCDTMFGKLKTLWGEDIILIKTATTVAMVKATTWVLGDVPHHWYLS